MDVDAGERSPAGGRNGSDPPCRAEVAAMDRAVTPRRPPLVLIEGSRTQDEGRIYRLRDTRSQRAPAEEAWPKAGAWRDLVRSLVRNALGVKI